MANLQPRNEDERMSREITYFCNLCRNKTDKGKLFALRFNSNHSGDIKLIKWPNKEFDEGPDVHLCFPCCQGLLIELQEHVKSDAEVKRVRSPS